MLSYNRWVEVDLDILAANYHAMREFLPHQTAIMAVVKNNAYGHGAVETAKLFQAEGVAMLAVTTLDEGVELRLAGIEIPILVFAPVLKDEADAFFKWDLTPSIGNTEGLFALAETAGSRQINCHLKVNTGMSRMGIEPNHAAELVDTATRFENIHITAVYSHFATALEADLNFAKKQLAVFRHVQEDIRALGGKELVYHICNSAVALRLPEARLQMVRLGSVLYGQCSFAEEFGLNIQNPWQVKAKVVAVRDLAAGQSVGYGRYKCPPHNHQQCYSYHGPFSRQSCFEQRYAGRIFRKYFFTCSGSYSHAGNCHRYNRYGNSLGGYSEHTHAPYYRKP